MYNLGPAELILIMAIALIVFGPKKLPDIGRGIGNALREFNKARNDFMESLHDVDRYEPPSYTPPAGAVEAEGSPADRRLEYPPPIEAESEDALPYGGDFHAAPVDSEPSFRAAPLPSSVETAPRGEKGTADV